MFSKKISGNVKYKMTSGSNCVQLQWNICIIFNSCLNSILSFSEDLLLRGRKKKSMGQDDI